MSFDDVNATGCLDRLLRGWAQRNSAPQHQLKPRRKDRSLPQTAGVLALVAHVHALAGGLQPHFASGLTPAHAPMVRAIYESTLTALWLDNDPHSATAWMNRFSQQRRAMRASMRSAPGFEEAANAVSYAAQDDYATSQDAQQRARSMEQICERVGFPGAYVYYRMLCEVTHPSVACANYYIAESDDPQFPFTFRPEPEPGPESSSWAWIVAACTLWSARLVDYLDGNTRRSELRQIAKELHTKAEVPFH